MKCPACPVPDGIDCMGVEHPGTCEFAARDERYRAALVRNSRVLAAWPAIERCPDRGGVLPVSEQREGCGCAGTELNGCRAGLGKKAGAVTLDDCAACVEGRPGR